MKKYIFAFGLFLFLVSGISIVSASHSWGGYHWARTTPSFTLKLGDDVESIWDSYLGVASGDWSVSSVLDTTVVSGATNPKNCKAVSGRVEVCTSAYGNNGWLGIAQIWVSGTHITQGTVKMNDTYFKTATYNTPAWRQFVVCQEIGHTFGLNHQDENFSNLNLGTCMDYTNDPSRNDGAGGNLHPNQHDYDELVTIYGHADSSSTVQSSIVSSSARDVDVSLRADWGRAIAKDAKGRDSQFIRSLGNGTAVVTHVIWAE